jgi:predicted esterase
VIFLHGLGDQGDTWAYHFEHRGQMRLFHVKYVFPNA